MVGTCWSASHLVRSCMHQHSLATSCRSNNPHPMPPHPPPIHPTTIRQFTRNPHFVMCSLVLVNAACNTALPLFIDRWAQTAGRACVEGVPMLCVMDGGGCGGE